MTENNTNPCPAAATLRQRAEALFRAGEPPVQAGRSLEDTQQALHELQVYQIELELQNEELRRTQVALEESRARYFDLYDLAPVGYFTLSEKGLMQEANLMAAELLGVERTALVNQPLTHFIAPEDQDIFYHHRKQLFETGAPQACELRMLKRDSAPFWVRLETTVAQHADGAPVYRAVIRGAGAGLDNGADPRFIAVSPDEAARADRAVPAGRARDLYR